MTQQTFRAVRHKLNERLAPDPWSIYGPDGRLRGRVENIEGALSLLCAFVAALDYVEAVLRHVPDSATVGPLRDKLEDALRRGQLDQPAPNDPQRQPATLEAIAEGCAAERTARIALDLTDFCLLAAAIEDHQTATDEDPVDVRRRRHANTRRAYHVLRRINYETGLKPITPRNLDEETEG